MFISIIIPTYNRAHRVQRTIESVLEQTQGDWELIIVDDGSSDDTGNVVKKYLSEKVRYVKQDNAGANKARNHGVSLARHPYLTFLDSDDELFPEWIARFAPVLDERPSLVCCGTLRIEKGEETAVLPKSLGKLFGAAHGKFSNGACYVIEKELFNSIGRFDEELRSGQHTELSFRLADLIATGKITVRNIYEPLVKIHIHDEPRIRNNAESKFRGAYMMLKKHNTLLSRYPRMKCTYAKIMAHNAYKQKHFFMALKAFAIYCKYSLIARFKTNALESR